MIRVHRSVVTLAVALAAFITLPLTADASETKDFPILDVTAEGLSVNGVPIPFAPKPADLFKALGYPSRADKKPKGIVYTFDDIGITFRCDPDDETATDLSIYPSDMTNVYSFAPKRVFRGKLRISGVEWPTGRSITDAQSTILGLAVDEKSFGVIYDVDVGQMHVSSYVDTKSKLSKRITIRLGPSRMSVK